MIQAMHPASEDESNLYHLMLDESVCQQNRQVINLVFLFVSFIHQRRRLLFRVPFFRYFQAQSYVGNDAH